MDCAYTFLGLFFNWDGFDWSGFFIIRMKWKKKILGGAWLLLAAGHLLTCQVVRHSCLFFQSDPGLVVGAWNFLFEKWWIAYPRWWGFLAAQHLRLKRFWGPRAKKGPCVILLFLPCVYLFSHFGNNMLLWNAVCISRPFCCYCTTTFIPARFFTPHCVVFLSREFNNLNYINITWIITAFWLFLGNSMWFLFCVFATFHLRSFLHDAKITIILYSRPSLEAKIINI